MIHTGFKVVVTTFHFDALLYFIAGPFLRLGGSDIHHLGNIVDKGVDWSGVVLEELDIL